MRPHVPLLALLLVGALLLAALAAQCATALPGTEARLYARGSRIPLKANTLASEKHPNEPLDAYALPFCRPDGGVRQEVVDLNEFLIGTRVVTTPYVVDALADSAGNRTALCTHTLTATDLRDFKELADAGYRVDWSLDGLAMLREIVYYSGEEPEPDDLGPPSSLTRYRIGFAPARVAADGVHIATHTDIRVLHNREDAGSEDSAAIVRFIAEPLYSAEPARVGERLQWTYTVRWEPSPIRWRDRYDIYMQLDARVVGAQCGGEEGVVVE